MIKLGKNNVYFHLIVEWSEAEGRGGYNWTAKLYEATGPNIKWTTTGRFVAETDGWVKDVHPRATFGFIQRIAMNLVSERGLVAEVRMMSSRIATGLRDQQAKYVLVVE